MDLERFQNKREHMTTSETLSGEDLFNAIYQGKSLPQDSRFLPIENGGVFKYFDLSELIHHRSTTFYPNVKIDGKIVALVQLQQDPNNQNTFWKSFVTVDPEFQGKGYASQVLEETFRFAKEKNMSIVNSSYNALGEEKLQRKNNELAQKYGVPFTDGKRGF